MLNKKSLKILSEKYLKPNLIIDSISLLSSLTGIGRYTNEVSKYIEKDTKFDVNYFYGYYSKKRMDPSCDSDIKSIKSFISDRPLLKKIARKFLLIASKFFAPKFDLYWVPSFIPLDGIKASKIVTTVHDFSFYIHADWHPQERLDYFNKNFFKNIQRSDHIITGSEFSKKEILEYLNFPEEKITVIYHGVDQELYKVYDESVLIPTKTKFDLQDDFLLFVGSIEPRKNLLNLLKAYHLFSDDMKDKYPLVLVGFKGWENEDIMQEIEKEKKHVKYLGYLSDEELVHVYNLATLFVYPSLYEGFGIPPLEAMACGTPVISSNVASLPEACGDAAVYVNPVDIHDISSKLVMVLEDSKKQAEMSVRGLEWVKQFTWEKSAKTHIEVFEKALEEKV